MTTKRKTGQRPARKTTRSPARSRKTSRKSSPGNSFWPRDNWFWLELDGGHKILVSAEQMPRRVSYGDVAMIYPASKKTQEMMDSGYDVDLTLNARSEGRRSSNKEVSDLIQKARSQGWTVIGSSGGHWIFRSPDKSQAQVVVPGTPSDYRSMKNAKSALRRAGLTLNRRRRLRRNSPMNTGAMIAIGAGVVLGIALLSRRSTDSSAGNTPVGVPNTERIAEALRGNREAEIARMMARNPSLTRADAEARYDRAAGAITSIAAAFTRPGTSGIGSYYRT